MNILTVIQNAGALLSIISAILDGIKNGAKGSVVDIPVQFGSKQSVVISAGGKRVKITKADFTVEVQ